MNSKQDKVLSLLTGDWLERLWNKVVKLGSECGCWLWEGHESKDGYPRMVITKPSRVTFLVHRAILGLHGVNVPDQKLVCHTCDTPLCVNPSHLFVSDQPGNVQDMNQKRRHVFGKRVYGAILTDPEAEEVREFFSVPRPAGSKVEMAAKLRVSPSTISDILVRRTWKHVK